MMIFRKNIKKGDYVIITKQYDELDTENMHEIFNGDMCEVTDLDSANNAALLRLNNIQAWFKFGSFIRA